MTVGCLKMQKLFGNSSLLFLKYSVGATEPKFKVLDQIPFEKKVAAKYDFSVFWAIQRPKKFFLTIFQKSWTKIDSRFGKSAQNYLGQSITSNNWRFFRDSDISKIMFFRGCKISNFRCPEK